MKAIGRAPFDRSTWTGFPPRRDDFLGYGPIGDLPLFLGVLKTVVPERRRIVLLREVAFAHLVLVTLLLIGDYVLPVPRASNPGSQILRFVKFVRVV